MRLHYILLAAMAATGVRAADFHVAPTGSDANSGTMEQPFATLSHALGAAREWKSGHVGQTNRLIMHGGEYRLENTLIITPDDSGAPGAPLVIQAAAGESPVITSARDIVGWQPVNPNTPGLQSAAASHVLTADIPVGWRFHYLYLDGQPQPVARMNKTSNWRQWPLPTTVGALSPAGQSLTLPAGLLDNVPTNGDLEMNLMPVQYWNTLSVVRDIDSANNTCRRHSKNPTTFWSNSFANGNFNLQNALKFLTQPGEWCVDSAVGKVYFWPPGDSLAGRQVRAPGLYRLMEFQGSNDGTALVHDVEIRGLALTCTDRLPEDEWPDAWVKRQAELPDAMLYLEGVADCRIEDNTFSYSGSYCVALQNYAQRVSVLRNEMAYPGCGGVQLQGYGPGTTDINHDNIIRRNYIHHTGNGGYLHSAAVTLYQSGGNDISLNWIDTAPYVGIQIAGAGPDGWGTGTTPGAWDAYGSSEAQYKPRYAEFPQGAGSTFTRDSFKAYVHSRNNRMTNNILTGYMKTMSDGGGLYSWSCGLNNLWDNNLLRRDFINPGEEWCFALYMDDYVDGATLSNNVCWHSSGNTTLNKGANTWTNNTISSTKPANYDQRLQQIAGDALADGGWLNWPHDAMPSYVGGPAPANGQSQVIMQTTLAWTASVAGIQYDLYFGTDLQSVAGATTTSPEYQGRLAGNSFTPSGALTPSTTYYWRVDAVASSDGIGAGMVWSFTTASDAIHGALRLHFPLDARDTFGTGTYDLAGPPFQDGTLSPAAGPPTVVTGRIYEAFHFDGSSNMVTAQTPVSASGYAVSLWFRTTQAGVGIFSTTSNSAAQFDRDLYLSGGKLNAYLWNGGASEIITTAASLNDGQWHHAVHTLGGSAGGQKLFVDGVLVASGVKTGSDPSAQTQVRLGFSMMATNHHLSGDLDDVMVWDRALDASEVAALRTAGLAGNSIDPPDVAGVFTWTGNSGGDWNQPSNWSANAVPGFSDSVHFNLTTTPSPVTALSGDLWVGGVVIGGGAGEVSVTGTHTLTVGPGGIVLTDPAVTATFSVPVVLRTSQTWTIPANGALALTDGLDTGGWNLTVNTNQAVDIGGGVTGGGGLLKEGAGTLVLSGVNSYTGNTTVNAGTMVVTAPDSLKSATQTINAGGTLELYAGDNISLLTNTHYIGAGVLKKTGPGWIGNANNPVTFNMSAGAVFDIQAGDWNLGGALASESMRTNLGSMNVGPGATFHTSNTLTQVDSLTGGGKINNAYNSSTPVLTIGISNTTDNAAYGIANNTATFSGTIGYAETYNTVSVGTMSVVKTGTGTQVLSGSNNYTGTTTVNGGVLWVNGSLASGSAVTVKTGARLGGSGTILGPVTLEAGGTLAPGDSGIGTLSLGGTLTLNSGGSVVARIHKAATTLASDKVVLTGAAGFSYTGSLMVAASGDPLAAGDKFTLFSKTSGAFGSGSFSTYILPVLPEGLAWDVSGLTVDGSISVVNANVSGTPTWTNSAGGSWGTASNWLNSQIAAGSDATADFSTLMLANDAVVTLDGARTVGSLKFGDTGNSRSWTVSSGTAGPLTLAGITPTVTVGNNQATINATVAGTYGLIKAGSGKLTLGSVTYTGATSIQAGRLVLQNPSSASATGTGGFRTASFAIAGGSTLEFALTSDWRSPNNGMSFTGAGTLLKTGTATMKLGGASTDYSTTVALGAGSLIDIQGGKIELDYAYNKTTWDNNKASMFIASGAAFDLWDYGSTAPKHPVYIDALDGFGTVGRSAAVAGTSTLQVGVNNGSGNFGGVIQNGTATSGGSPVINLIKSGTGTQILSGINTHTGTTTVNGGTLSVNGSLAAGSAVTVNSTATLAGTGTAAGTVNIAAEAFVAPGGDSLGTLTTGAVTLAGTFRCQLDGTACDRLAVTGNLSLNGATLVLAALHTPTASSYVIATYTGSLTGTFSATGIPVGYALDYATAGQVRLVASVGFSNWIDGFTFTAGADKSPAGDPDHDGISNGLEMVLGGNPATGMDTALMPAISLVNDPAGLPPGDYFLFTYRRSDLAVAAGLSPNCMVSADLGSPWTSAVDGTGGVVIQVDDNFASFVPPSTNTDRVRVYLPRGSNPQLFGRLGVSVP